MTDSAEIDLINLSAERRARAMAAEVLQPFVTLADSAFETCGLERPPRPRTGENPMGYVANTVETYLTAAATGKWMPAAWGKYMPGKEFVEERTTLQDANALAVRIFDAGIEEFRKPKTGPLREVKVRDQTGREITRFDGGSERAAWEPYTFGERVIRILKPHCENDQPAGRGWNQPIPLAAASAGGSGG